MQSNLTSVTYETGGHVSRPTYSSAGFSAPPSSSEAAWSRERCFWLDLACRRLFDRGAVLPVEPKTFDLIALLVEERHRVVTRDELNARVWNGDRVCRAALTQCVWCARQIFGDTAKESRFILTQHRRGYRFVGRADEQQQTWGGQVIVLTPAPDAMGAG